MAWVSGKQLKNHYFYAMMKEYFEEKETEVIRMYMTLYDDETIIRNHDAQLRREVTQQVTQQVTHQKTEEILSDLLADGSITPEKADEIRKKVSAGV